jgi:hypothetical protein
MLGKLQRPLLESALRILSRLAPILAKGWDSPAETILSIVCDSFISVLFSNDWAASLCACEAFSATCSDVFLVRDTEVRLLVYILICLLPRLSKPPIEVPMVRRLDRRPSLMYFSWEIFFLKHFMTWNITIITLFITLHIKWTET